MEPGGPAPTLQVCAELPAWPQTLLDESVQYTCVHTCIVREGIGPSTPHTALCAHPTLDTISQFS